MYKLTVTNQALNIVTTYIGSLSALVDLLDRIDRSGRYSFAICRIQ